MAENDALTVWTESAPEDGEFINRIPQEIRFLRGAVRTAFEAEHVEVQSGSVVTGARHKMGAARAFISDFSGGYPTDSPAGIQMSTTIDTSKLSTCDVGRIAVNTNDHNRLMVYADDSLGTAIFTNLSVGLIRGTAVATMYAASHSVSDLQIPNANWFKARNAANNDEVNIAKVTGDDSVLLVDGITLQSTAAPATNIGIVCKQYVTDNAGSANYTPTDYANDGSSDSRESVTYPNGLIVKSGYVTDIGGTTPVAFDTAFPNGVVSVMITVKNGSISTDDTVADDVTVSGFNIHGRNAIAGYYWEVRGY